MVSGLWAKNSAATGCHSILVLEGPLWHWQPLTDGALVGVWCIVHPVGFVFRQAVDVSSHL